MAPLLWYSVVPCITHFDIFSFWLLYIDCVLTWFDQENLLTDGLIKWNTETRSLSPGGVWW